MYVGGVVLLRKVRLTVLTRFRERAIILSGQSTGTKIKIQ